MAVAEGTRTGIGNDEGRGNDSHGGITQVGTSDSAGCCGHYSSITQSYGNKTEESNESGEELPAGAVTGQNSR